MGINDMQASATPLPHVLVAEDNPVNAMVLARQLSLLGYTCTVAGDGEQAWAALQVTRFVAVLTDCEMPVLDGYDLTRRIRAAPAFAKVPIIALSARPDPAQERRCKAAGMDVCLHKPISNADLAIALAWSVAPQAIAAPAPGRGGFEALRALFPTPQSLASVLGQFVQTTRADITQMERLYAAGMHEAFGKVLHRIAGGVQLLHQHDVAAELTHWHRKGGLPSPGEFAHLQLQLKAVLERVEGWRQQLPAPH